MGQLSVNEIQGIQSQGEIANVKHYAANNQETDRYSINETVSERALREIYLPAFEASAVRQGRVSSVMSAYPPGQHASTAAKTMSWKAVF